MESRMFKVASPINNAINLKVIPGHFATNHSHINFYLDMTTMKTRQSEAMQIAKTLAGFYNSYEKVVDTIICMDGCEVIGAYLAQELEDVGIISRNLHETMYVITPEFNNAGQMIFRENLLPSVAGKNVLLLMASATTGKTIRRSLECINYYGGRISGLCSIFSAVKEVEGYGIDAIFTAKDIPGYATYASHECPYCKKDIKIDAIVNGFGYSKL